MSANDEAQARARAWHVLPRAMGVRAAFTRGADLKPAVETAGQAGAETERA